MSVLNVPTIAELKDLIPSDGDVVIASGYSEADDGGGGQFRYDSSSSVATDEGIVIAPNVGSGRFIRMFSGAVNIRWWGALPDGQTNCRDAIQSAISYAIPHSVAVDVPSGVYFFSGLPLSASDGALYLVGNGDSTILGPGKSSADGNFIKPVNTDIHVTGITFEDLRDVFEFSSTTTNRSFVANFTSCIAKNYRKFLDYNISGVQSGSKFKLLSANDCYFASSEDGVLGDFDFRVVSVPVESARFVGCTFSDGGDEALYLSMPTDRKDESFSCIVDTCNFRHYTGNQPGGDADCHFIRFRGQELIVSDCTFNKLYVADGISTLDTEAIRCEADQVTISGCHFTDCGLSEAVVQTKECKRIVIDSNIFRCTSSYQTWQVSRGSYGVALLYSRQMESFSATNNKFYGFNGAILDADGNDAFSDYSVVTFRGNEIWDSPCNQYSSFQCYLRTHHDNVTYYIEDNKFHTSDGTSILAAQNGVQIPGGTAQFFLQGNRWNVKESIFRVGGNLAGCIEVNGDHMVHGKRIVYEAGGQFSIDRIHLDFVIEETVTNIGQMSWYDYLRGPVKHGSFRLRRNRQLSSATTNIAFYIPEGCVFELDWTLTARHVGSEKAAYLHKRGAFYRGAGGSIERIGGSLFENNYVETSAASGWGEPDGGVFWGPNSIILKGLVTTPDTPVYYNFECSGKWSTQATS